MRFRGKPGWVRQGGDTFLNPDSVDDYAASTQVLTYLLGDGLYEVNDANFGSSRCRRYWLKVEEGGGKECDRPVSTTDTPVIDLSLPDLQGTPKQIAWATDIMRKAIEKLLSDAPEASRELVKYEIRACPPGWIQAVWWIDNRQNINALVAKTVKGKIKEAILPYPKKIWEVAAEEYRHEGEGGEWVWKSGKKELLPGEPDDWQYHAFCQNPETKKWEIWHYDFQL
jgi:hypothetical protein